MFKRKKKPGCETPTYIHPNMPPVSKPNPNYTPPPSVVKTQPPNTGSSVIYRNKIATPIAFEEYRSPKFIRKCAVDTEDRLDILFSKYDDIIKIENADIYWSEKDGVIAVRTTQEWKDYFMGKRNIPESEMFNNE